MRRLRLAGVVALAAAVSAAIYALGPYAACYVAEPTRERLSAPPRNMPDCPHAMPTLTSAQETDGEQIALADSRVTQILADSACTVEMVYPWTAGTCLIGAVTQVRFSEPRTITADWPLLRWDASGRPVYPARSWHATFVGLTGIAVSVDLQRREVVQIHPGYAERVVEPVTPGLVLQRVWQHLTYCPQ